MVTQILKFLKNNLVTIIVALAAIFFLGRGCDTTNVLKQRLLEKDERILELNKQISNSHATIVKLEDSLDIKDAEKLSLKVELDEERKEKQNISRRYIVALGSIQKLTSTQADSVLNTKYSHVPPAEKSREILRDLSELDEKRGIVNVQKLEIAKLESIVDNLEESLRISKRISAELQNTVKAQKEIIEQQDGKIKLHEKAYKKMRRQRNMAAGGGILITILVIIAAL